MDKQMALTALDRVTNSNNPKVKEYLTLLKKKVESMDMNYAEQVHFLSLIALFVSGGTPDKAFELASLMATVGSAMQESDNEDVQALGNLLPVIMASMVRETKPADKDFLDKVQQKGAEGAYDPIETALGRMSREDLN